ncbi:MAG: hypothetical protein CFE23_11935, partial [Flavobacterium sp. BFFFF1]|uniref:hypothetical protein n=1 Tax=Flavobacterium sp. BFFFF1 TaxID=2015557 RepID=UPI000BD156BA
SLIKPVLSDDKERMSQRDFVSVAFCTGALIAVLVTFLMVTGWGSLLKNKNEVDLKRLADNVSKYFSVELNAHVRNRAVVINDKTPLFAKMEIRHNSLCFLNDSVDSRCDGFQELTSFNRLEEYFTMDSTGLIASNRNKEMPGIRRMYRDREYFKLLKDVRYDEVLTGVLSRRDHNYQWIYAKEIEDGGISGISFRDNLSQIIKVPPGTAFLIVKGNGDILFQNDPGKVLRGNLLEGTSNEAELLRLLAGNDTGTFTTEYQGVKYQMYGQKLRNGANPIADNPIYVIAMRDLRFQESLSLFSFSNTFLITLLYGVFIMLLMMVYSATLYAGRLSVFSKQHLAYLFPDNSRTKEYRKLFEINSVVIIAIAAASFILPASIALWLCLITGVNIAFLNFALLNNNRFTIKKLLNKTAWLIALNAVLAFIAIYNGYFVIALLVTFSVHFGIIARYKKLKVNEQAVGNRTEWNKGINRKYYSRFFTMVLLKHFGLLPFLLCTTIYITELNDISVWYCASADDEKGACIIEANGCGCDPKPVKELTHADVLARHLDIGLLGRPSNAQLESFSFTDPRPISYLKTTDALSPLDNVEKAVTLLLLFAAMCIIYLLTKGLIDYYSNRFFFFSLMQAGFEHYYKESPPLPVQQEWPCEYADDAADSAAPSPETEAEAGAIRGKPPLLFSKDKQQLWPMHRQEFILHENLKEFDAKYEKAWNDIPAVHRNVLFDFSRDHFLNYKNRDILISLMEAGVINCNPATGRLRVSNEVFRVYILNKYKKEPEYIADYKQESKDGFFTKLRLPLIIVAVSLLVLLMYLNKESFSQLLAFGTAITTTLGMVNNLMKGSKPVG